MLPIEDINYFTVTEAFQEVLAQNVGFLTLMVYETELDFQHWGWEEYPQYGSLNRYLESMDKIAEILIEWHKISVLIIHFNPDSFAQWLYPTGFPNSQVTRAKWTALQVIGGFN